MAYAHRDGGAPRARAGWAYAVAGLCLLAGCVKDNRDLQAIRTTRLARPSGLSARSWGLCSLIGPLNAQPGMYGSDLGFSVRTRDSSELTLLFGDSWAEPTEACQYPAGSSDDLQAYLPAVRPAMFSAGPPARKDAVACGLLELRKSDADDATSWPRMRLFPDASHDEGAVLDTSALRTPVAAFSDGARVFGIFHRNDPAECAQAADCPTGMQCSSASAAPLGACEPALKLTADAAPAYCRNDDDCGAGASCKPLERNVCLTSAPFEMSTPAGVVSPTWYRDDPRRGIARTLYVGAAIWPDRPADYATLARFTTNRFQNLAARTVARFDPEHPERNDYRPGYHTLLVWGRAAFVEKGGAQALPFLMYQPLDALRGPPESVRWQPRFFAGYERDGRPRWSQHEADAQPVYGLDASIVAAGGRPKLKWTEPELDYVNQMALSWVAPLSRWVMLYGGDVPAFMVLDPKTSRTTEQSHPPFAPGAIHLRSAQHPWGRMTRDAARGGWSSPEPALTRHAAAPYLACGDGGPESLPGCLKDGDPHTMFDTLGALAGLAATSTSTFLDVAASCVGGELAHGAQNMLSGDRIGRLYGPNILDEWTEDVTEPAERARGEHAVEIYWNASTWNPYQVVLWKTRLSTASR